MQTAQDPGVPLGDTDVMLKATSRNNENKKPASLRSTIRDRFKLLLCLLVFPVLLLRFLWSQRRSGASTASQTAAAQAAPGRKSSDDATVEVQEKVSPTSPPPEHKREITYEECRGQLAEDYTSSEKWFFLTVVFLVQISMNFNTSLYSNGIGGISKEFDVSEQAARAGAAVFLITYAFGCELWAPWSEEIGRWPVLQASLFLVNVFQLPVALAPNLTTVLVGRALGGLATAGGSITLGMVADMWDKEDHQHPVNFVVLGSVGGSVFGAVIGGVLEQFVPNWRWYIWVQLLFGAFVQVAHFFFVPETRSTILQSRVAARMRAAAFKRNGERLNIWGPVELRTFQERFNWREIGATWMRPFKMLMTEMIVLSLSCLSGFADALIFMFIQSFGLVYKQWEFNALQTGLAFLPFLIAYIGAWASFIPAIRRNKRIRTRYPDSEKAQFESRLWWLLYTAPCLTIGLIGLSPGSRPWSLPASQASPTMPSTWPRSTTW